VKRDLPHIGWREWVSLPALGVPHIKAKIDTGARSSALHAFDIEYARRGGVNYVRFVIHPLQRSAKRGVTVEVPLLGQRSVKSSNGIVSRRPVILTEIKILGQRRMLELTLVSRDAMGFRLLLGREAIRNGFLVDAGRSFLGGRPKKRPPGPPPIRARRG